MKVPKDPGWFLREGGFQRCLEKREGLVSRGAEGHSIGGNRLGEDRDVEESRSRKDRAWGEARARNGGGGGASESASPGDKGSCSSRSCLRSMFPSYLETRV